MDATINYFTPKPLPECVDTELLDEFIRFMMIVRGGNPWSPWSGGKRKRELRMNRFSGQVEVEGRDVFYAPHIGHDDMHSQLAALWENRNELFEASFFEYQKMEADNRKDNGGNVDFDGWTSSVPTYLSEP